MIMKKDVNFGLFVLIIATLFVFAGFTSYYQTTFENLSSEYQGKLDELGRVTTTLQHEKIQLNQTSLQLQIKAEREQDLSSKYETIRGIKEQLEKDKAELESELLKTKSELATANVELATTKEALQQKAIELSSALTQINSLINEKANLNAQIDNLEDQLATYKACCEGQS